MRNTRRKIAVVAAVGLVAAGGSAFTAANSVPKSAAGFDGEAVSGYTATDIRYTLDDIAAAGATGAAATSDDVAKVTFLLDPTDPAAGAAVTVRAQVTGTGTAASLAYVECDETATTLTAPQTEWECELTAGVDAVDITGLNVVAAQ